MNFFGSLVTQRLVTSLGIAEGKILLQSRSSFQHVLIRIEIDILLLDASPQPFHEDIVQIPSASVHADSDIMRLQYTRKLRTGEVTALIGIEDVGLRLFQGFMQTFQTKINFQGIGDFPVDDIARVPIDDGYQVGETFLQFDIGDVDTPDLIGFFNVQISQEVGIDWILSVSQTEIFLRIQSLNAHCFHQGANFVPSDGNGMREIEFGFHPSISVKRMGGVDFVDKIHRFFVVFGDAHRLIVEA